MIREKEEQQHQAAQKDEAAIDAEVSSRLIRLRDATDSITAHPQFAARLMARLELERPGWLRIIPSLWQKALPVAMLLAMMSAVWAYHTTQEANARFASANDASAEIDW